MYDVFKLIRAAEAIPISERPLPSLFQWAIRTRGWTDGNEQPLRMREVLKAILRTNPGTLDWEGAIQAHPHYADHIARIRDADCRYPILLEPNGDVIDGMHRIAKGFLEQRPTLPVRQFTSIPEQAKL